MTPSSFEGAADTTGTTADGWQSLGDSGIEYRYGLKKTEFSDSVSFSEQFSETSYNSTTTTETFTVPVPINWTLVDVFWFRLINESKASPSSYHWDNLTREEGEGWAGTFSNSTFNWRLRGITVEHWNYTEQYKAGLAGPGPTNTTGSWWTDFAIGNSSQELGFENFTIPIVDWRGETLANVSAEWYIIQYFFINMTTAIQTPEVIFQEILIPAFILVEVEYDELELIITVKTDYQADISGSFNLSASYEETVWGHDVEIKLADRYHLAYRAIENATGTYSLSSGFAIDARISFNNSIEVRLADDSYFAEDNRPGWLQSSNTTIEGHWSSKYEETATFFGVTALQGIVQGVLTKLSNESYADLLIWGGWKPGRMFGYTDMNGNNRLDIQLNGSVIESPDVIFALGLPEGIHLEGSANATSVEEARYTYQDSVYGTFKQEESSRMTESVTFNFVHGFDPYEYQGITTLDWQDPSYNSETGKAQFSWTLDRTDWPVFWYVANRTYADTIIDTMDFSDTYNLEIDTKEGIATLQNDYEQSAVTNETLANMVEDLSLATYHRDIFLSVSHVQKGMDGAMAQKTDVNDIRIGGISVATAVFGDTKANYTIGNPPIEDTTHTTVLNLLTMSGQIGDPSTIEGDEEGNPFISPVAQRVALGLVQLTADGLDEAYEGDINWVLSENIVLTSYPTWGGDGPLVHDPTFTATFATKKDTPTTSDGISSEDTGPAEAASAASVLVIGTLLITLGLVRCRKRK